MQEQAKRAFSLVFRGKARTVGPSDVAELRVLLEGVPLPADKARLLAYAVRQRAEPAYLAALRALPEREYGSLTEVAEAIAPVQPQAHDGSPPGPREESGEPPGGDAYVKAD